jgi:hypothetical protein
MEYNDIAANITILIEVYARIAENSRQRIGTFQISEAAALGDAIIRDLQPPL